MSEFRDFVADLLERKGAAVEALEPDELEVLAPAPLRTQMGWPELAQLGFGTERAHGAIAIGLEGDWLDRFGALLEDKGRWSEREVRLPAPLRPRATRNGCSTACSICRTRSGASRACPPPTRAA